MIVIHNGEYNPRIDFIVCKQLLCSLPPAYDELRLRESFEKECGILPYENDVVKIKKYFSGTDITAATITDVQNLYGICTGEKLKIDCAVNEINNLQDIVKTAESVKEQDCQHVTLFQILLLFGYCKTHCVPIMPYHGKCEKLYFSLRVRDYENAEKCWQGLIYRLNKYSVRHSIAQNEFCFKQLKKYKNEFLQITGADKLGIYGSIARGTANEYSDVDIIAIIPQNADCKTVKRKAFEFWNGKIPIHFDITVTTECDIQKLPVGIRSTIKFL